MEPDYRPDFAFELTLWKRGESFGTLSLGLGLRLDTRQLLFYFGDLDSDRKPAWWMVAERDFHMLEFFLDHKIYFDGQLDQTGNRARHRRSRPTYEVHFPTDSYDTFRDLLNARLVPESDEPKTFTSPKRLYALVEILALIINQMDIDKRLSAEGFEDKWDYFLDLLEE